MEYIGNGLYQFTINGQTIQIGKEDLKDALNEILKYEGSEQTDLLDL